MYGYFDDLGYYGDAVSDLKSKIKEQRVKIRDLRKAARKTKILTNARRLAELKVRGALVDLRALQAQLRKAQRDALFAKKGKKPAPAAAAPAAAPAGGLTQAQIDQIKAMVKQLTDAGVDADAAEEQVKARVLPPGLRRAFPRRFFRPFDRRGPRSIDPVVQQRSIDPRLLQRSIDPRIPQVGIDPFVPQVGIDPRVGGRELNIASGAFQFPPGNLADEAELEEMESDVDLSGVLDTVKAYAMKPWVLGLAAIGAVVYGPKLLRKLKGGGKLKSNPKRRRKSRRSRRR